MYECLACIMCMCVCVYHVCPWSWRRPEKPEELDLIKYVYESTCGAGNPPQVSGRAVNAL